MKLVADRTALHAAFQHVGSIITSTIARPIYQNVKMEVVEDSLFLSATDLEVGLKVKVDKVEICCRSPVYPRSLGPRRMKPYL